MPANAEPLNRAAHHVGRNLRLLRAERGLSLRQLEVLLAEMGTRIPFAALGNIENGKRGINVDEIFAIAEAMGVGVSALLFEPTNDDAVGPVVITSPDGSVITLTRSRKQLRHHHLGLWPIWLDEILVSELDLWELAHYQVRMDPQTRAELRRPTSGGVTEAAAARFRGLIGQELAAREELLPALRGRWDLIRSESQPSNEGAHDLWLMLKHQVMPIASAIRSSRNQHISTPDRGRAAAVENAAFDLLTDIAAECGFRSTAADESRHQSASVSGLRAPLQIDLRQ